MSGNYKLGSYNLARSFGRRHISSATIDRELRSTLRSAACNHLWAMSPQVDKQCIALVPSESYPANEKQFYYQLSQGQDREVSETCTTLCRMIESFGISISSGLQFYTRATPENESLRGPGPTDELELPYSSFNTYP